MSNINNNSGGIEENALKRSGFSLYSVGKDRYIEGIIEDFNILKPFFVSSESIRNYSYGEVYAPDLVDYKTSKPENNGLFCENIFGSFDDSISSFGLNQHTEEKSKDRKERMGHIELAYPLFPIEPYSVAAINIVRLISAILDISIPDIMSVIDMKKFIVINPANSNMEYKAILSGQEYKNAKEEYGREFISDTGTRALQKLLFFTDLEQLSHELRDKLKKADNYTQDIINVRLAVIDAFLASKIQPEWMILDVIPVTPPGTREYIRWRSDDDTNELYREVLLWNKSLKHLLNSGWPEVMYRAEIRNLQIAVSNVFMKGLHGWPLVNNDSGYFNTIYEMPDLYYY